MNYSTGFRRQKKETMEELHDSIQLEFLNNYQTFHRHQKQKTSDIELTESEEISIEQLPNVIFPNGVEIPEKRNGPVPSVFQCPILTDFILLKNSNCNPLIFLHDVDVFTTLASLRSLICQWINYWGPKSDFFRKNPHYCHMDEQGRVFLNTGTNYTVPFEKSTAFLNRFTMLEHGQNWEDFIGTSYSGLAKIQLKNGIRVAFTYKMYAQSEKQPVDIIIRPETSFQNEIDYHFLNCLLTNKKLWRYDLYRNNTIFRESLGAQDLWKRMSSEKQMKILDCFESRLPEFLLDVAYGIQSEDVVNIIHSVTSPFIRLTKRPYLEILY